ncbi:MAG: anthranilate phosphoribosyltransferase [Chloroflexota bacterium]|nr:anthranilate phosphoribosyltransferase [Chloroflexota bacterium]
MTDAHIDISHALRIICSGESLDRQTAFEVMRDVMTGAVTEYQIAGLLAALQARGETPEEVAGFAEAMRSHARSVELGDLGGKAVVDTCGTGGDGSGTFNVSTTAAFVVAGAGVAVAKHGNRAASSKTGSADLLEALGAKIAASPDEVASSVRDVGFGFMLAPEYHPAMRHVMPVRRGLGVPTVFNILGPLCNPAGVKRQVIGVRNMRIARLMASVLDTLGSERVLIVTSAEGADELTLTGVNRVVDLDQASGGTREYDLDPTELGFESIPLSDIRGGSAAENAEITRGVLEGEPGPHRDTVLLNAAAGLIAAARAERFADAVALAAEAIDSGAAMAVLDRYVVADRVVA